MPAMIRNGGKMWDANGRLKDVKAVMPESTFARIYQEIINLQVARRVRPPHHGHGAQRGLMAQQVEEYGSHDKTFEIPEDGVANITDLTGEVLLSQNVEQGDIWRMCQVKDAAIRDWVKLAVNRARNSGMPVVFWLDQYRPHEAQLITKVKMYLHEHNTTGLDIQIKEPVVRADALHPGARDSRPGHHQRHRQHPARLPDRPVPHHGTGHLGQDAVHRAADGRWRLQETARYSAPATRAMLVEETTWALGFATGEFLALAVSLEDLGLKNNNPRAKLLAKTLDAATGKLLDNNKNPSPKTGQLDNRGSQFYLALYWAQELAAQTEDAELAAKFAPLAKQLTENEQKIVQELNAVQGQPTDIGGYYLPDVAKLDAVMRPSETLNKALASVA
ncbi:MAG: NADP-dependent isocitrate dehydrogenase [Paenacidovorax caeni]